MNLPNKLTMLRMLMIPLFIACFYLPESWLIGTLNGVPLLLKYVLAAVVFLLAYVTDTLDGRIARARGLVTDFGKLMDPTADKLLTSAALIMLCRFEVMSFGNFLMPVFTFIIIAREIFVSGIRQPCRRQGHCYCRKSHRQGENNAAICRNPYYPALRTRVHGNRHSRGFRAYLRRRCADGLVRNRLHRRSQGSFQKQVSVRRIST